MKQTDYKKIWTEIYELDEQIFNQAMRLLEKNLSYVEHIGFLYNIILALVVAVCTLIVLRYV